MYDDTDHRNVLKNIELSDTLNMFVGESRQIQVVTNPSNYSFDSLRFRSSDTAVLSISKKGLLTALKEGVSVLTISNLDNTVSVNAQITVTAPEPDSLTIGLIAYYPFNNTVKDSSGNDNDGTAHNITFTPSRSGNSKAAYFDGLSSYIAIKDNNVLRLNNTDFTLNIWVNLDSYINASGSSMLSKNTGAYQNGWNCSIVGTNNHDGGSPGNLFYNVSGGLDPFAVGTLQIDTAKWYMLTITYELSKQKVGLYINGVLDANVLNIPTPNANTNAMLHIGNNSLTDIDPFAIQYFFKGYMDDIRIYNRKLSASEIVKLHSLTDE
ncbi:hypothetical protein GCM10023149_41040 [Mucilaginibacter gynuensis]|uniref:LamG-like jellyroll fold domain-containing protein n=2 Tax=Mucilaginibacter gynuensis TaxID=1302236 RepID=A0ABP8H3W1_9SPHI